MTDLWAIRQGTYSLSAADPESAAQLAKVPRGTLVHVEVRQPRNIAHHRLFWALVHRIADGIGCDAEALADHLKVRAGHVRTVNTQLGVKEYPASISFAAMDQAKFSDFFNRCVTIIVEDLGIRRPDVLDQVKDLIDGGAQVRA